MDHLCITSPNATLSHVTLAASHKACHLHPRVWSPHFVHNLNKCTWLFSYSIENPMIGNQDLFCLLYVGQKLDNLHPWVPHNEWAMCAVLLARPRMACLKSVYTMSKYLLSQVCHSYLISSPSWSCGIVNPRHKHCADKPVINSSNIQNQITTSLPFARPIYSDCFYAFTNLISKYEELFLEGKLQNYLDVGLAQNL